jgi:DNA-binding CsgD family transcriptional regulator
MLCQVFGQARSTGASPMSGEVESSGRRPEGLVEERRKPGDRRKIDRTTAPSDSAANSGPGSARVPTPLSSSELAHALTAVLEKFHRGVLVIDQGGFVHAANAAVTKMAAAGDSFRLAGSRLSFKSPEHQRSLERFLAGPDIEGALALKVERAEKQPPYRVLVSALTQPNDTVPKPPLFTVFVYQPHAGRHIPLSVLRELYGLTAAEARLAIRLFSGESIAVAASATGISTSTVRSHLKHIFEKCDVQSQGELLQLLSLGPRTA